VESEKGFERRKNGVRHTDNLLVDWRIWSVRVSSYKFYTI